MKLAITNHHRLFFSLFLFISICSCKQQSKNDLIDVSLIRVRMGSVYYSIYLNKNGNGQVIKGIGSDYQSDFKEASKILSDSFKIDSISQFYSAIEMFINKPYIDTSFTDAARLEIYFNDEKIYDAYKWRQNVADVLFPLLGKLPHRFDPFQPSDDPFDKIKIMDSTTEEAKDQ